MGSTTPLKLFSQSPKVPSKACGRRSVGFRGPSLNQINDRRLPFRSLRRGKGPTNERDPVTIPVFVADDLEVGANVMTDWIVPTH